MARDYTHGGGCAELTMANILLGIPSGGSVKSKTMMTIISVLSMTQHRITVLGATLGKLRGLMRAISRAIGRM